MGEPTDRDACWFCSLYNSIIIRGRKPASFGTYPTLE